MKVSVSWVCFWVWSFVLAVYGYPYRNDRLEEEETSTGEEAEAPSPRRGDRQSRSSRSRETPRASRVSTSEPSVAKAHLGLAIDCRNSCCPIARRPISASSLTTPSTPACKYPQPGRRRAGRER